MNTSTTDVQDMQVRKSLDQLENRQAVDGSVFRYLCVASFISFALFCLDPCTGTMWLLLISLAMMVYAGGWMFRSASAVIQHKQALQVPAASAPAMECPDPDVLSAAAFYATDLSTDDVLGQIQPWIEFPKKRTDSWN